MTKEEYYEKYRYLTVDDYKKMTKKKLLEIKKDFEQALENGVQEYRGLESTWTVQDEINYWWECHLKRHPKQKKNTKAFLIDEVLILDVSFSSMNEMVINHRYHDLQKMVHGY